MAINIGNQFDYGRNDIDYGKIPLWDSVDEQYPSGVYVAKDSNGHSVGTVIHAGTPVEIDNLGGTPKLGESATNPTGLARYDATVGTDGCTLTVVTRGAIYVDRIEDDAKLNDTAQRALAGRILFIKETASDV